MQKPKRPRGRPRKIESMNIVNSDIEDVAETIKLHMLAWPGVFELHVDSAGNASLNKQDWLQGKDKLPDEWLVGSYTGRVSVITIEDDLTSRLKEIKRTYGKEMQHVG